MPLTNATLSDYGMTGPADWAWPVTFRYRIFCNTYQVTQELTLDIPVLEGKPNETATLAKLLWLTTLAGASTSTALCATVELMCWRVQLIPALVPVGTYTGIQRGDASAQEDTITLVLMTGGVGKYSRRKLFIPATPARWQTGRKLNTDGWEEMLAFTRGIHMGLSPTLPSPQCSWLVAYTRVVQSLGENYHGVGFKPVRDVKVCELPGRAPDASFRLWP